MSDESSIARTLKLIGKTTLICIVGLIAFVVLSLAWNFAILQVERLFGMEPGRLGNVLWLLFLVAPFVLQVVKLPRFPMTAAGSVDIAAPIEEVWDQVRPRPRTDYFLRTTPEIRAIAGQGNEFDYVLADNLNGNADAAPALRVSVVEEMKPYYLATFTSNCSDLPMVNVDAEANEYRFEDLGGATRVIFRSTLSNMSVMAALTRLLVNPSQDSLKVLKARCEGSPDTSWLARFSPLSDETKTGTMQSDIVVIAVTAVVVITVIAFGLIGAAVHYAPSA